MVGIEEIKQAVAVCTELQAWLDAVQDGGTQFCAGFTWDVTLGVHQILIGNVCLWDETANDLEEMTFLYCRSVFVDHCDTLADIVRAVHPSPFSEPFTHPRSSIGLPKHS